MPSKAFVTLLMIIGSTMGGLVPLLFGADMLSYSSVIGSGIGGLLGIYLSFKLSSFF